MKAVPGVGVLGTGRAFAPSGDWVDNATIHELLYGRDWSRVMPEQGLDPDYPERVHGFVRRHWSHVPGRTLRADETTSADLMESAARRALAAAERTPQQVDLFIAVSTTSPRYTSSLGTIVGGRLGLRCASFEMKAGCSSALYALTTAYRFLAGGAATVLVAAGETLSRVIPPRNPFVYAAGDAGGAVVLGRVADEERGLVAAYLDADGAYSEHMGVPGALPPIAAEIAAGRYHLAWSGEIEAIAREKWLAAPRALFEATRSGPADLALYIPHQVNRRMIDYSREATGIPADRTVHCLERYGNCGSVSVLLGMDRARRTGRLVPGARTLLNAVGGGLAWGGVLLAA